MRCFVSHRSPFREGGSVSRVKKRDELSASEGRAAKYESLRGPFARNQMV